GLPGRIAEVPPSWIVGFQAPHLVLVALIGGALTAWGLWLLARKGNARERRAGGLLLGVAATSALVPLGLALVGADFFYYRQLAGSAVLVLIALAAGFGARSAGAAGLAGAGALLGLSLAIVLATLWQPKFNREDWRGAVRSLGTAAADRAVVVTPKSGDPAVSWYAHAGDMPAEGAAVREVDVIGGARNRLGALTGARTPRPVTIVSPAPGLRLVARRDGR